jgi:hypothetical protein
MTWSPARRYATETLVTTFNSGGQVNDTGVVKHEDYVHLAVVGHHQEV